jgi:hypothetical protein
MSALDRLRAREISEQVPDGEPTEPTKVTSVGFVGAPQGHSSKYSPANDEPDADALRRRDRALTILAEQPERQIAVVAEAGDPAYVAVAVRGVAVGELTISAERYDSFALLALMEQYGRARSRDTAGLPHLAGLLARVSHG